jgi:branched-chain amino acid transport system ATP-binding protein
MLEVDRLEAGYGDVRVLSGVCLALPRGRVVALLGANGAGKTTLLRCVSGLLRPWAGRVRIEGMDLTGRPPEDFARAGVCHVPEGRSVFRSLTVREHLLMWTGGNPQLIERVIDAFPRLGERLHQPAGTMSGGEQQMLALGRAYVTDARYVLLDEVSLGLAPVVVDEIFQFLRRLAATGRALLLVEQYVTRALELADLVFVLNRGQVAFAGEPGELDAGQVFSAYVGAEIG